MAPTVHLLQGINFTNFMNLSNEIHEIHDVTINYFTSIITTPRVGQNDFRLQCNPSNTVNQLVSTLQKFHQVLSTFISSVIRASNY